jgi:hypothetical protein
MSLAAALATVLFAGYLNAGGSTEPNMGPVIENLHFEACTAMKSGKDLNISLTLACDSGCGKALDINEFKVNTISQHNISDLAIYVNGTLIDTSKSPMCKLVRGNHLQVNLVLPSSNGVVSSDIENGAQVNVDVITQEAVYYHPIPFQ